VTISDHAVVRRSAARPVRIELAGIPGAGKTRLSRALAAGIAAHGLTVVGPDRSMAPSVGAPRRIARKAAAAASVALSEPGVTARLARAVLGSGQPGLPDVAGRFVQWQVAQALLAAGTAAADVQLQDEGPVQCLWSLGLRGDVEPALRVLESSAGWRSADLLVVVRIEPAAAAARLATRRSRHSRIQALPATDQLAELVRGELLLDRLVSWWARTVGSPERVLVADGTHTGVERHRDLVLRAVAEATQHGEE
jgi:hypothetical protein